MLQLPKDLISELVQYLEIRDVIEIIKTCPTFASSLGQNEDVRRCKERYWKTLIRWEIDYLDQTFIFLKRKKATKKMTKTLEYPIGTNFENLRISYNQTEFKKYYVYIDWEQRKIVKWFGKEFGRVKYRTLTKLVQRKPKSLEMYEYRKSCWSFLTKIRKSSYLTGIVMILRVKFSIKMYIL